MIKKTVLLGAMQSDKNSIQLSFAVFIADTFSGVCNCYNSNLDQQKKVHFNTRFPKQKYPSMPFLLCNSASSLA